MVHVNTSMKFLWLHFSIFCIQNYKMSIFTKLPFVIYLLFHCNISKKKKCFFSFDLQKFNDEEWANMPSYNLVKIMHNIRLQQLGNRDTCLYTLTVNDYVWAFKQPTLYGKYLWGGPIGHELDRNELLLRRAQWSSDFARLVVALANYMFVFTFFYHILHLKGEEVCGSAKRPNYPPSVNNDSHHLDHVNFSRPRVTIHVAQPNVIGNIGMQQPPYGSNACLPLVSCRGLEFKENICVDGQWWIECCPPKFAVWCFALQKTTRLKCKTNINLYKFVSGTFAPCYLGLWV